MNTMIDIEVTPTDWIPESDSIIKVLGVGGGGCNAVNYMYSQKIEGCTFVVCNTDSQALNKCDVPIKIQLGEGLGAGTNPTEGRNAALNSQDEIASKVLDNRTEMLFITAGMGGGTGTGAAPVIASMARKKGILTVGVVTIPFRSQGPETMIKAIDGINELEKNVDSLLIIDNEKILAVYGDLLLQGCGTGTGENRIEDAVRMALESPLLNDYDLTSAKNFLINITVGNNEHGVTATQYGKVAELIKQYTGKANNFKSGLVFDNDPSFGDRVNITVIVTGIKMSLLLPHDMDNIIEISSDFVYDSMTHGQEGIELPEVRNEKIGYNNAAGRKKDLFADGKRPVLLAEEGQSLSDLEYVAAIRRKTPQGGKRNE